MSISSAKFIGKSDEVICVGRKPFCYSYDSNTGKITKITGVISLIARLVMMIILLCFFCRGCSFDGERFE